MPYNLLPFRFERLAPGHELITNEVGEFLFAEEGTVARIVNNQVVGASEEYKDLLAKHIIVDERAFELLDILATKLRTKKDHIGAGIALQLVVITRRCNQSCSYCQVSRQERHERQFDMSEHTIDRVVDAIVPSSADRFTLEIQGGEPLLVMERVEYLVEKAKAKASAAGKQMSVVICTNLSLADDSFYRFCQDNQISISTSLDGPQDVHDTCRVLPGGDSYAVVVERIRKGIETLGADKISALMTTTRKSLDHARRIVDEYVSLGLTHIFIRRLNDYGFARAGYVGSYSPDEFLEFYLECLKYIIQKNLEGITIAEVFASLLLTRILTPYSTGFVDLLSPPGLGISFMVYDYNGKVYPSDEARMLAAMGDETFLLGNLLTDSVEYIFKNPKLKGIHLETIAEGVPGCVDCAFLPYCGADPIHHYNTQNDLIGNKPNSCFCRINRGVFRFLFQRLLANDPDEMKVFWSWIRNIAKSGIEKELPGYD